MLPLKETRSTGTITSVGTISIVSPSGLAVTARHCVIRDGHIYIDQLWVFDDDTQLQHVASFQDLDTTVLQLVRKAKQPGGSAGTPVGSGDVSINSNRDSEGGSSGGGSICSGSGNSSGGTNVWPFVNPADSTMFVPGRLQVQPNKIRLISSGQAVVECSHVL